MSEPCRHERAPQSDVDAFGVLGDAGSRFEPGEADPAWRQWARDEIRRLRKASERLEAYAMCQPYWSDVDAERNRAERAEDALREIRELQRKWARQMPQVKGCSCFACQIHGVADAALARAAS